MRDKEEKGGVDEVGGRRKDIVGGKGGDKKKEGEDKGWGRSSCVCHYTFVKGSPEFIHSC